MAMLGTTSCADGQGPRPIAGGSPDATVAPTNSTAVPASTVPAMPNESAAEALRQARRYQLPDPVGSLQRTGGLAPHMLAPGNHVADSLGIEVTLATDEWWRLEREEPGSFSLTRPDAIVGAAVPAVVFLRPVGLAPASRVGDAELYPGEYTVSPDDLGAWLDDVDQLAVLGSGTVSVGGRDSTWFDVDVVDGARV